jgi:hypothetical protein
MNMVLYYILSLDYLYIVCTSTRNVWLIALGLDPLFPLLSGCFRRMGVREVACYNAFSMIASRSCLLAEAKDSTADDGMDGKVVALIARQLLSSFSKPSNPRRAGPKLTLMYPAERNLRAHPTRFVAYDAANE